MNKRDGKTYTIEEKMAWMCGKITVAERTFGSVNSRKLTKEVWDSDNDPVLRLSFEMCVLGKIEQLSGIIKANNFAEKSFKNMKFSFLRTNKEIAMIVDELNRLKELEEYIDNKKKEEGGQRG